MIDPSKNRKNPSDSLVSLNSRQSAFDRLSQDLQVSKDSASIYGGIAGSAAPIATPPHYPKSVSSGARDEIGTRWSRSVSDLLEQPPATLPQRLIYGGLGFCLVLGAWSWFGTIEEVGHAQGKLMPKGSLYKIQPIELGKVRSITVKEGDEVKAGQVLVELDTELAQKEVDRLQDALTSLRIELMQKQGLLEKVDLETQTRSAIATAEEQSQESAIALAKEKAATARQLLMQQQTESAAYQARKARLQPLSTTTQERLQQLQAEKLAHQERLARLRPLEEEGAVSQEFVFQAEQSVRETEQRITQSRLQEVTSTDEQQFQADQSLRDLQAQMTQNQGDLLGSLKEAERLQSELLQKRAQAQQVQLESLQQRQQLEVEITQLEAKITENQNLLVAAQTQLKHKYLKAPVNGVVFSLELKNSGEVIEAGQIVAEIAPLGAPLVLSALLPNQEAGFIKQGLPVKVKLDAYPYQDYGIISGKVTTISEDAKPDPDKQLGDVYQVEVELAQNYVTKDQQQVGFKAGQTASADIIIRRRRILDLMLDPIKQMQKDGINL